MAYDSHAGLGTQLENSKHLISMATTYPLYSPIFALIKLDAYGSFVISVETAKYTPFVKIGLTIIKALLIDSSAKPINMLFSNILIRNPFKLSFSLALSGYLFLTHSPEHTLGDFYKFKISKILC